MTWDAIIWGVALALAVLMPLALKWQLPLGLVGAWAVLLGAASGALWQALLGGPSLAWGLAHLATVLVLSGAGAAFAFFRDPERSAPNDPGALVSPADGRVIYIRPVVRGEVPPVEKHGRALRLEELASIDVCDEGYLVGISMHLLNVHVNRAPIEGSAVSLIHTPGRFLSLKREEAMTANERMTTVLERGEVRIAVVQIASRLVRRIVTYIEDGQHVDVGQRIGMIRFGSQVDVVIPRLEGVTLSVEVGQRVRAGVSVLGTLPEEATSRAHKPRCAPDAHVFDSAPRGAHDEWADRAVTAPCKE